MIKVISAKQKKVFDKVAEHPLQTWEWGEFRKATGNEVIRLATFQKKSLKSAIQIMLHSIPFTPFKIGTFIKGLKPTREIIKALKDLASEENVIFIKLEPNFVVSVNGQKKAIKDTERVLKLLRNSGAVSGKTLFTPTSFWIDLTRPEDEILSGFHSKTRYNIHLAERRGVKVVEDNSDKAFERYIQLTRETVERQEFYAHTERYHRLMWKYLHKIPKQQNSKTPIARLLTAHYKGEIVTCWIVFVWHDFIYYPYGASTDKYKNLMANNLIMWEAIKYGKRLGLKTFDLWGREPGKGFTRFKEGYNPSVTEFLGTWDLITSPLYYPYRVAESFRWAFLRARSKLGFVKPSF